MFGDGIMNCVACSSTTALVLRTAQAGVYRWQNVFEGQTEKKNIHKIWMKLTEVRLIVFRSFTSRSLLLSLFVHSFVRFCWRLHSHTIQTWNEMWIAEWQTISVLLPVTEAMTNNDDSVNARICRIIKVAFSLPLSRSAIILFLILMHSLCRVVRTRGSSNSNCVFVSVCASMRMLLCLY